MTATKAQLARGAKTAGLKTFTAVCKHHGETEHHASNAACMQCNRAYFARYHTTAKGRAVCRAHRRHYRTTDNGRAARRTEKRRYWASDNGRASKRRHYLAHKDVYYAAVARRRAAKAMAIPLRWLVGDTIGDQSRSWDILDARVRAYHDARARGDKSVGLKVMDLIRPAFAEMQADWQDTLAACELLLGAKLTTDHKQPITKLGEDSIENYNALTKSQNSAKGDKSWAAWLATLGPPTFVSVTLLDTEPTEP